MVSPFLVEAEELLLAPEACLLVDARKPEAYEKGHIPGAVSLSTYEVFVPGTRPAELAAFREDMARRYGAAGASRDRAIVVYEDDTGMRAARELWILEYMGHANSRMLHGGLKAWLAAGGELSTDPVATVAAHFSADEVPGIVASADDIHAGESRLLDVRDAKEFAGQDNTACCTRRGRLPGAAWLEWTELLDPSNGKFRSPGEIRAALAQRGIDPGEALVPYCHRGARSANTYYALLHAGCTNVRNYIGSFHDWSARADLPVEV